MNIFLFFLFFFFPYFFFLLPSENISAGKFSSLQYWPLQRALNPWVEVAGKCEVLLTDYLCGFDYIGSQIWFRGPGTEKKISFLT